MTAAHEDASPHDRPVQLHASQAQPASAAIIVKVGLTTRSPRRPWRGPPMAHLISAAWGNTRRARSPVCAPTLASTTSSTSALASLASILLSEGRVPHAAIAWLLALGSDYLNFWGRKKKLAGRRA